jgi:hypothetical protein
MATLTEMAEMLRQANPENKPMNTRFIAAKLWPDADWLKVPTFRHNGGPKRGQWVAAGAAARMGKRGLLRHSIAEPGCWHWTTPNFVMERQFCAITPASDV